MSEATDAKPEDIVQINRRIGGRDMSLNAPVSDAEGALEYQDTLVTDQPSPEATLAEFENSKFRRELFVNALEGLKDRERHIFTERKLRDEPATLQELGQFYGLSRERIRQIEAKAMSHVESYVRQAALDDEAVRASVFSAHS